LYGFLKDKNMSRIGKKPIIVPQNVTANIDGNKIEIKGPNGLREFLASKEVEVKLEENQIVVRPKNLVPLLACPYNLHLLFPFLLPMQPIL